MLHSQLTEEQIIGMAKEHEVEREHRQPLPRAPHQRRDDLRQKGRLRRHDDVQCGKAARAQGMRTAG